jgi:hypothetical protein
MSEDTCPRCGAPLRRQTDRRKACGYSLRCSVGGHPRSTSPRTPVVPRRPRIGTKSWLTDPTVRVCKADGCLYDAGTCRHARR